jgi:hypothetical protein
MAYNTINTQLLVSAGQPVDAKLTPVQDFSSLASYAFYSNAYNGLEVMVLNGGYPVRMMLVFDEGTSPKKYNWVITHTITTPDYASLSSESGMVYTIVDTLSTKKNVSRAFAIGQKAIVLSDETREGNWAEYIVTGVSNGYPSWEYNHADPGKFEVIANSASTSIELYYDGVKLGESAGLSEIITQFNNDHFISSGGVVTESGDTFIELYYNDNSVSPIRINVSNLGGSQTVVLSGYTTQEEVESAITQALASYATSAATVSAIENATKPSIEVDNYSAATVAATSDNVGRIINVQNEQIISGETYSSGLYIVTGAGEVSKLGTTSATGDVEGDVETLKGRVGTLESAMYWLTDDDLVIE